jgi:L-aspartate oxidase
MAADRAAQGSAPLETGTLVLGSGLAGLYAALRAAERGPVAMATRGSVEESSSFWAQGGVAAAVGRDDDTTLHGEDTLRVGRGLCRESAVRLLVGEAPRHVDRLRWLGVEFDEVPGGSHALELTLEAGHSRRRIAHAGAGSTGRVIVDALVRRVVEHPDIRVLDDAPAVALLAADGRCHGAVTRRGVVHAESTVLATGGMASLWARSTNPASSRGEGVALAWRAGAAVADMEFVQFHPTALVAGVAPGGAGAGGDGFLLSEALRGEGAHLLDARGKRFLVGRHEAAELAPRDELSRLVYDQLRLSGEPCVFLSMAHLPEARVRERFASIATRLAQLGLDLARDPIPVSPAAHYTMGGVLSDLEARTTIDGLTACGEVACTGVHGANRLASNSLLECLVFADRAGAATSGAPAPAVPAGLAEEVVAGVPTWVDHADVQVIREALWTGAGVLRDASSLGALAAAAGAGDAAEAPPVAGLHDSALVARLVARSALLREESRGAHFRSDFPEEREQWRRHIVQRADEDVELATWT